jgi:hypothetical protein
VIGSFQQLPTVPFALSASTMDRSGNANAVQLRCFHYPTLPRNSQRGSPEGLISVAKLCQSRLVCNLCPNRGSGKKPTARPQSLAKNHRLSNRDPTRGVQLFCNFLLSVDEPLSPLAGHADTQNRVSDRWRQKPPCAQRPSVRAKCAAPHQFFVYSVLCLARSGPCLREFGDQNSTNFDRPCETAQSGSAQSGFSATGHSA